MNNTKAHQKLLDDLLFAFGSLPNVRIWPRGVGVARALDSNRVVKYGIKGETDLDGLVHPSGRRLSIEVKTGSGRLTKEQLNFKAMIVMFGGIYIEARSVDQALADFKKQL